MKEYIDRDALITTFNNTDWYSINKKGELILGASDGDTALFKAGDVFRALREASTADVAPVVHGEWIERSDKGILNMRCPYMCNICGRVEELKEPYCNCGAKMDGGKK